MLLASVLEEYSSVQKALENYSEAEKADVRAMGIRVSGRCGRATPRDSRKLLLFRDGAEGGGRKRSACYGLKQALFCEPRFHNFQSGPFWAESVEHRNYLVGRPAAGVGFVSLTEALDLTTPAGRAMAALLAVFAEFEREILRERVRAGLAHARQNGTRLGRPQTTALQTSQVRKLYRTGVSKDEIACRLQIGRTSVRRNLEARP